MCVICVLCLIVVPLPPGRNPFAVKINNNLKKNDGLKGFGHSFVRQESNHTLIYKSDNKKTTTNYKCESCLDI
jgi:hypothetical protein